LCRFFNAANNKLTGTLPSSLTAMTSLTGLDVSGNAISGSVPPLLPAPLRQLELSQNRLSGSLPSSLTQLTALTRLGIDDNSLSGSLPLELLTMIWLR
jgi:Leucine-rich repeat (LRR) protein